MSLTKKRFIEWQHAKKALDDAKAVELEYRKEICSEILGDKVKGTKHFKDFGFDATAVGVINEKLDIAALKEIFPDLNKDEKACIKYKPELVAKHYKELPDDSIFHKAVTTSAGTPSLKIKEIEE